MIAATRSACKIIIGGQNINTCLGGNSITCPDPGAAGSSDECKGAHKTPCTILGSGEGMCDSNTPD